MPTPTADAVLAELVAAADGLLVMSESDYPLEAYRWAGAWPPPPAALTAGIDRIPPPATAGGGMRRFLWVLPALLRYQRTFHDLLGDQADGLNQHDTDIPANEGVALAALWPQATVQISEGLGQRRILRDPASVAQAVNFLAEQALEQQPLPTQPRAIASSAVVGILRPSRPAGRGPTPTAALKRSAGNTKAACAAWGAGAGRLPRASRGV
jgi:hypothetical protein